MCDKGSMKNFVLSLLSLLILSSVALAESSSPFDAMGVRDVMASARAGDKEAQHALAMRYYHGRGIKQNLEKAYEWHTKAAMQDHSESLNELGWMHLNGEFVPQDEDIAIAFYERSAALGNPHGCAHLAEIFAMRGDFMNATMHLMMASDPTASRYVMSMGHADPELLKMQIMDELTPEQLITARHNAMTWQHQRRDTMNNQSPLPFAVSFQ